VRSEKVRRSPDATPAAVLLALQRGAGNAAVARWVEDGSVVDYYLAMRGGEEEGQDEDQREEPAGPEHPEHAAQFFEGIEAREASRQRKQEQLAQRDQVAEERRKRKAKAAKQDEHDEEGRKQRRAESITGTIAGKGRQLAETIRHSSKGALEDLDPTILARAEAAEKLTPETPEAQWAKLESDADAAAKAFELHRNRANHKPKQRVERKLDDMKKDGLETAAKFKAAPALGKAWKAVKEQIEFGDWWLVEEAFPPLEEAWKAFAPIARKVTYLDKRLKTLRDAAEAPDAAQIQAAQDEMKDREKLGAEELDAALTKAHKALIELEKPISVARFDSAADADYTAGRRHHEWTATGVLVTLYDKGLTRPGVVQPPYHAVSDGVSGYSIEMTMEGMTDITVHIHVTENGTPAAGNNPWHWKYKASRYEAGASYRLPVSFAAKLLKADSVERAFATVRKR
jgi:hypothetical protein